MKAPVDSPLLAGFAAALDEINALADASPGFVWRLEDEAGDATSFRVLGDDSLLVNLSVWENIEALREFVFRGGHGAVMRRRREWFDRMSEAYVVLWWVEAGNVPSLAEAEERLLHLRRHGPTPRAFTWSQHFEPTGDPVER